ncbi:GNAT family N-acetyltransferase [Chryseobacterium taklimakanense]|uniref:GNAT family N-acetyltransferase n=1 Tax=Chryseobacterium taklimakanense TaxID=536441 RepID=UPI000F6031A3|nr:GNAT family N-acetyltransferase [Chryseobacterium taklimakanense]AZI23398.1 GNAT family N-acetyltransferase [Chryseobacterium taklimakanense]
MNFHTELIPHFELYAEKLADIIALKSMRWPYSFDQHKNWIQENIKPEDVHLLIYDGEKLVAYTNFVAVKANINASEIPFMGIGNVCTAESGKGYGNILMNAVSETVSVNNWRGLLFCKDHLVLYYEKFGWKLVPKRNILTGNLKAINTMTFNYPEDIYQLEYSDRNF